MTFPTMEYFTVDEDAPHLEYLFVVQKAGIYELELYVNPSNQPLMMIPYSEVYKLMRLTVDR